jgi:cholesterol transport system auxiliary component
MINPSRRRVLARATLWTGLPALAGLGACASLLPKATPSPTLFALDDASPASPPVAPPAPPPTAPTLIVNTPRAVAGFDTPRIVYVRQAHELEAFAYNQWVEPPALMLAPLIAKAVERTGAFRAVLQAPTSAVAELRLDTELIRLQHEFLAQPSRVRLTLRAVLFDTATRRVVAWREFDTSVTSATEDPYGGVVAANQAVGKLLAELAAFCAQATSQPPLPR